MLRAAALPSWIAAGARPGTSPRPGSSRCAMSPITNASGWPGIERSGCTCTRPARSSGTPSERPRLDAWTPAAQKTLLASMRSPPALTPAASIPVTAEEVRTSTPSVRRSSSAWRERSSAKAGSTRGPASSSTTRALRGSMRRKSRTRTVRLMSAMAPASSTPVGPPPTTTKVSSARCAPGSGEFSAASNAERMRRRISVACSSVFSPGARSSHSGCPK